MRSQTTACLVFRFERRLCRRNLFLGEASREGALEARAVEAPSDFFWGEVRKGGEAPLRVV